jgi:prepilin-type N-terminal cleavage/methylation domain-containing protein
MKSLKETIKYQLFMNFKRIQSGFTLIELIVTVLMVAIFGSMIIVFFGSSITKSSDPITRLKKTSDLHKIMENITADYNKYPKWKASASYSVNNVVIPTNMNGRCYKCTTAGTSGTSEPTWPLTTGGTVSDGTGSPAGWTDNGKVHDANSLTTLKNNIGAEGSSPDNSYGKYSVDKNRFIQFDPTTGNETSSATNDILKVSIKNDIGETLTALFMSDYLL